ncbi:hypothetical protein [Hymenobacter sp. J193]|nr:hypothetical protein [Hymenobacter sp. J193]
MVSFGGPDDDPEKALADAVQENFMRVRQEVRDTLALHVNTLA